LKTVVIKLEVPDWLDEEALRKAIKKAIYEFLAPDRLSAEEVKELFGTVEEEVPDELFKGLREKERERVRCLY